MPSYLSPHNMPISSLNLIDEETETLKDEVISIALNVENGIQTETV